MDRINDPSATSDRKFTDGDDLAGIEGTIVTDVWATGIQEEAVGFIEGGSYAGTGTGGAGAPGIVIVEY